VDHLKLMDMTVLGRPELPLLKAFAVLASELHPTFARQAWMGGHEISKRSCVLTSLAVRDFLFRSGFTDAEARPVKTLIRAEREGEAIHSVGIGFPPENVRPGAWSGHMVVALPKAGYIVDCTLFPALRPAWPDVTGMVAAPINREGPDMLGLRHLAGFMMSDREGGHGEVVSVAWLDDPKNKEWRGAPDSRPRRRDAVIAHLAAKYKEHLAGSAA
jgi:hypothetical protein